MKIFMQLVKDQKAVSAEGLIKEMSAKFMQAWNFEGREGVRIGRIKKVARQRV